MKQRQTTNKANTTPFYALASFRLSNRVISLLGYSNENSIIYLYFVFCIGVMIIFLYARFSPRDHQAIFKSQQCLPIEMCSY